jgi:hypothetical protein
MGDIILFKEHLSQQSILIRRHFSDSKGIGWLVMRKVGSCRWSIPHTPPRRNQFDVTTGWNRQHDRVVAFPSKFQCQWWPFTNVQFVQCYASFTVVERVWKILGILQRGPKRL